MANMSIVFDNQRFRFVVLIKKGIYMKTFNLIYLLFFSTFLLHAQVGINTTSPNATLDIVSSNQAAPTNTDGMLIPKVDEFPLINPTAVQDGMMIYVTGSGVPSQGFYYWNQVSTSWVPFATGSVNSEWLDNGSYLSPVDGNSEDVTIGGTDNANARVTVKSNKQISGYFENSGTQDSSMIGLETLLNNNSSNTSSFTIGAANYVYNSGAGYSKGTFNSVYGPGNGPHYGIDNRLSGNGTGHHYGMNNLLSGTGSGDQVGINNAIIVNSDGIHSGVINMLTGDGEGNRYGMNNTMYGNANGTQYGMSTSITSSETSGASHYGTFLYMNGSGDGNRYGSYSLLQGTGNGNRYGSEVQISNAGNGTHYGNYHLLSGAGTGNKYGSYNFIPPVAGGTHYGIYAEATKTGSYAGYFLGNVAIGTDNTDIYTLPVSRGTNGQIMQTDGSGNVSWVTPSASSDTSPAWYDATTTTNATSTATNIYRTGNIGIGLNNPLAPLHIYSTTNQDAFNSTNLSTIDNTSIRNIRLVTSSGADSNTLNGIFNNVTGTGDGNQQFLIGLTNFMNNASNGFQTGVQNSMTTTGNGAIVGVENTLASTGSGLIYGLRNILQVGSGNQYGTHTTFTPNGASTVDLFGNYVNIDPTATSGNSYGIYSNVLGGNAYAGYFLGNVSIGTTTVNTYTLPPNRGTNGQIMQTDGSGNVSWVTPSASSDTSPAWHDEGTTTEATTTSSDIIRTGNIGLGVTTTDYSLEIFDNRGTSSLVISMDDNSIATNTISYGLRTLIDNDNNPISTGDSYAIENNLNVLSDNGYGVRNNVNGHLGGVSTIYGIYNNVVNPSNGDAFGTYNNVGSVTGNNYGSYNIVNGSGIGVYSSATGGAAAGLFLGSVSIGTTVANTYTFPPNRGVNGQIMQTDGSGNVSWVTPSLGVQRINDLLDGKSDNDGTNDGSSIFLGINAGASDNSNHNQNIGIGFESLTTNTNGAYNIALGYQSQYNANGAFSNTAVGYQTLYNTTTGSFNTTMGDWSMLNNTTGGTNTAIGYSALRFNTIGDGNVALGGRALWSNTVGDDNVAIGKSASESNTGGYSNVSVGAEASFNNATGSFVTAVGNRALYNSTSSYMVAVGNDALYSNTSGFSNVAIGYTSSYSNTVGAENVSVGNGSLYNNISGLGNVAVGFHSLYGNNHTGSNNIAIGRNAMYSNSAGSYNVGIGEDALYSANASQNVAIGYRSLYSTTSGTRNLALGHESMFSNTTGSYNTALGYYSLRANTTGINNVAVGYLALDNNSNGYYNTALGSEALSSNLSSDNNTAIGNRALWISTGSLNTAVGSGAMVQNTSGYRNNAFGYYALSDNSTGERNTAMGSNALDSNTTGSYNTALGNFAFSNGTNYSNSTGIGYDANPNASNTIRLGNASVSTIGGFANWTNVSDGRFKTQVKENVMGLDFILKLRPVTYKLDMNAVAAFYETNKELRISSSEISKAKETQIGFIAQEVATIAKDLNFDFHGVDRPDNEKDHYGIRYAEFVPVLVKAIQEQQEEISALKEKLSKLEALEARIAKLEQD